MSRPPVPPFTLETAARKVRIAEDAWNSRDPERVAGAYTEDSRWRNRAQFFHGRAAIVAFLPRKWANELDYRLIKELWAFDENRIAVRFQYEWRDDSGQWSARTATSTGSSTTTAHAAVRREHQRRGHRRDRPQVPLEPARPRPAAHPGLTELGF